jgi:hypothetical protein
MVGSVHRRCRGCERWVLREVAEVLDFAHPHMAPEPATSGGAKGRRDRWAARRERRAAECNGEELCVG